jgi:hypothetical protein
MSNTAAQLPDEQQLGGVSSPSSSKRKFKRRQANGPTSLPGRTETSKTGFAEPEKGYRKCCIA